MVRVQNHTLIKELSRMMLCANTMKGREGGRSGVVGW